MNVSPRLPLPFLALAVAALLAPDARASGRGRHKQIYATPAPGEITVDGDLEDWDLSGQILSYVVPETQDMQSARTAMMYDGDALYVSGIVRDTSPMMNRHDPKTDADKAWDADVCQIFFGADPDAAWPLHFSSFDPQHKSVDAGTMMLWYFTDRQEPCLAVFRAMGFNKPMRPDLGANGVIPPGEFSGAFRRQEDGGGYTFEYRIPWAVMGMKRTPKANDIIPLSLAVFWSRPDGLKTAGGAAWAYDVMNGSGFSFQNANVWGKLILWPENNVDRKLVAAGLPPEKPLPLKFSYDVPEDSEVTVQLFDAKGESVRMLVAQQFRRAGANTELWDGCDDSGVPLPPGTYAWKGVYHQPVAAEWRFSVHNSGNPPYPTDDNRGGWGGDHGTPAAACRIGDDMFLSWDGCEYGWGVIRVDASGRKLWGSKYCAAHMATDGRLLFLAGPGGFFSATGVQIIEAVDSRPASLPNGKPSFFDPEADEAANNGVSGLACAAGKLYVSYAARDLAVVYDAATGDVLERLPLPAPGRLAIRPADGALLAISQGKVVAFENGAPRDLVPADALDEPVALDVAADGSIVVACRGARQNLAVFAADGTPLRSIGKAGGRPAIGAYDPSGMYFPGGIALDAHGRVWVAETTDGPKRVSVWNTASGALEKEFFGGSGYFGYGCIDPDRPGQIYAHHTLWDIDWSVPSGKPASTAWRPTAPNQMPPPGPEGYNATPRVITANNGRQYIWGNGRFKSVIMRAEGDHFVPFAAFLSINRGYVFFGEKSEFPLFEADTERYSNGAYFWQDANNDQTMQEEEIQKLAIPWGAPVFVWLDKDLNAWLSDGRILRPVEVTPDGQPLYDYDQGVDTPFSAEGSPAKGNLGHGYFAIDADGSFYTMRNGEGPCLVKRAPDGTLLWDYPDIVGWHNALNMPITGPGRLWGTTGIMGVGGDYVALMTYFGVNHIIRNDGVYIAAVLKDGRVAGQEKPAHGTNEGQPEGQNGQFVKLAVDGRDRYFVIHGGQDSRVWEVVGLDTVKDLEGGTYEHTEALAAQAADGLAEYNRLLAETKGMPIVRGREALSAATAVGKHIDSTRSFETRLAYDARNLYVAYSVAAPAELVNAAADEKLLFHSGNCLDIQIATDANAPLERGEEAGKDLLPGDIRILVTRRDGQPFARCFAPKVAGFEGEPDRVYRSPTGTERFDRITEVAGLALDYRPTNGGFEATVTLPFASIGMAPLQPGQKVRMDVGYIFGNAEGTRAALRAYARNEGFSAGVVNDIPNESRLEPRHWGVATVE